MDSGSICQIYPASAPGLPLPGIVTGRANVVSIKNYQIVLAYNIKPQNFRLCKELIKNTFVVKPDIYFDGYEDGVLKLIERQVWHISEKESAISIVVAVYSQWSGSASSAQRNRNKNIFNKICKHKKFVLSLVHNC